MSDSSMNEKTITQAYRQTFGDEPEIIVRAPGRINLIGEHTDYNGGFVLPAAIDKAIWFAAKRRTDRELHFHALDLRESWSGKLENFQKNQQNWANYLLGVLSEGQKDELKFGGVQLVFGGDVPLGAGLSSSAAVESGMIFLLNELFDLGLGKMDLVKLAQRGENRFVGMQCGIMDMFASVMGRKNSAVRLDCRSLEFEYFPFDAPDFTLILCDTGVKHALVDSEYNTRREECEQGVQLLQPFFSKIETLRDLTPEMLFSKKDNLPERIFRRCKYVVEEIRRVELACEALKINDLAAFGKLMFATHEGLQREYEVSCPELDFLVGRAKNIPPLQGEARGAVLGARMMGGGFGGCTINLIRKDSTSVFFEKMKAAYRAQFGRELPCYEVALTDGVGGKFISRQTGSEDTAF